MKNLITRTITGIFFVVAIIGSVLLHPLASGILFLAFMVAGLLEFYRLTAAYGLHPQKIMGIVIGILIYSIVLLVSMIIIPPFWLVFIMPLLSVFFIAELFRSKEKAFLNLTVTIFSIFYITFPLAILNFYEDPVLTGGQRHIQLLAGYFLLLWIYDIFAYLAGSLFGRHKLYERISPKKTWEGAIGGLVFTLASAFVLSLIFKDLTFTGWLVTAFIIVVFGTFGDLAESMFKRNFEIKDTGMVLPGHGGVLDRFDSLFLSAPAVYCYLLILFL